MGKNAEKPKKKHILRNILLVILVLIIIVICVVSVNAAKNTKMLDLASERVINSLSSEYELKEVDCSEFDGLKVYGFMGFDIKQYDVEDIGNLCVMKADGGVMQMLTVCLTPAKKDLPLISVDYMYMLGNRIAYVEVYDLSIDETDAYKEKIAEFKEIADNYTALNDTVPTSAWYDSIRYTGIYKKVSSKEDMVILDMMEDYLDKFVEISETTELLDAEQIPEKTEKMESYTHRLISEGGVSTDVFIKELGEERTRELFDKVMFGTVNYKNS